MTTIDIRVKHKEYYPDGETWLKIAHEKDNGKVDDDYIYHYVDDDVNFKDLKVGDKIMLDEEMEIMEIYIGDGK